MKKFILFFIFFFFFFTALVTYDYYNFIYIKKHSLKKELVIKKGEHVHNILKNTDIPFNNYIKLYLKLHNLGKNIKAGYFNFNEPFTIRDFFNKLQLTSQDYVRVTIPEGYTLKQIKKLLQKKGLIDISKFEDILKNKKNFYYPTPNGNFEGYFFPETYFFSKSQSEEDIIDMFLNKFMEEFPQKEFPDKEIFYRKLILASIIEKEAADNSEKDIIASVFENRLKIGMRLQSCATLAYIFDYKKSKFSYKDTRTNSNYNTYLVKGLTPSPICNPGKTSVSASLNPVKSKYYYFVLSKKGKHIFSKTYKEHMQHKKENE